MTERCTGLPSFRWVLARLGVAAAVVGLLLPAGEAFAHDVPDEMVFEVHVVPDGDVLHVPLRVPLVWLAGYQVPLRDAGYIDLADEAGVEEALQPAVAELTDELVFFEDGERLDASVDGWRLSLPSDRSFEDHRQALDSIAGPSLDEETNLFWNQGYLDVHLTYPIGDEQADFSLEVASPSLAARLHVLTTFVAPDGASRSYDLLAEWGRIDLNPGLGFLSRLFTTTGLTAILTSWEHVLFVAAVALGFARRPRRPLRPLVAFGVVFALVVLASGASAGVERPHAQVLVTTTAAASVLIVAVGNVVARSLRLRWLTAALCAVPHGLLAAGGLDYIIQFREPGDGVLLTAYTAGALASIAALFAAALGVGWFAARHTGVARRGPVVAALLLGYVGWRHTLERGETLVGLGPPPLDQSMLLGTARWAAVLLLVIAALWFAFELFTDWRVRRTSLAAPPATDVSAADGAGDADATATVEKAPVAATSTVTRRGDDGAAP